MGTGWSGVPRSNVEFQESTQVVSHEPQGDDPSMNVGGPSWKGRGGLFETRGGEVVFVVTGWGVPDTPRLVGYGG